VHVVGNKKGNDYYRSSINVRWRNRKNFLEAKVKRWLPDADIALLEFTPPPDSDLPCVYLDKAVKSGDDLYTFGYPDKDDPNGRPSTFDCEGFTGDEPPLIMFKLGQVLPGMSGAPLLNRRTGKVCGVL